MSTPQDAFQRWLEPGMIWEDPGGDVHFDIPAMLKFLKMENTAENRQQCADYCCKLLAEKWPLANVSVVEGPCEGLDSQPLPPK